GGKYPHPRPGGDRDRRHRVDPRGSRGGAVRRPPRHRRTRLPARSVAPGAEHNCRLDRRARAFVDVDLSADGSGLGSASGRPVSGCRPMKSLPGPRTLVPAAVVIILALLPVYTAMTGNPFALTLFNRIIILALAAVSLNLILGYGG